MDVNNSGKKIKVALVSLGCDKNLVESEVMLGLINEAGGLYELAPVLETADCIVINTCGFIKAAVDEAEEHIQNAVSLKGSGACKAVVAAGCMAQRFADRILKDFPQIDAIVANTDGIVTELNRVFGITGGAAAGPAEYSKRVLSTPGHYAYLKIAEGCDNCCAYCSIPIIKGSYKSRARERIISEAETLAARGVKELILVAQDTSLYGVDLYGESILHSLVGDLSKINGIEWIRIMYTYPEHITDGLIAEIAANPKVCRYLDIPVQHCSSKILKLMGRSSSYEELRGIIQKLRAVIPDISLRTTVITGFPGETNGDFLELLEFIRETRFDRLGAFEYSREEGTPAYNFPNQVDEKTKKYRRDRIMSLQMGISGQKLKARVGKTLKVIIDGQDGESGMYFGRSHMDSPDVDGEVFILSGKPIETGSIISVKITGHTDYDLFGETEA